MKEELLEEFDLDVLELDRKYEEGEITQREWALAYSCLQNEYFILLNS